MGEERKAAVLGFSPHQSFAPRTSVKMLGFLAPKVAAVKAAEIMEVNKQLKKYIIITNKARNVRVIWEEYSPPSNVKAFVREISTAKSSRLCQVSTA